MCESLTYSAASADSSLGLRERAGMRTVGFCESDPYCRRRPQQALAQSPLPYRCPGTPAFIAAPPMLSAAASHVRTSASPARALVFLGHGVDSGENFLESLAWFNPITSSWKTYQRCLIGGWKSFSETWPRSGMTRSGKLFLLPMSEPTISANVSGSLPTLTVCGNYNRKGFLIKTHLGTA